jgi:hypothetical protein
MELLDRTLGDAAVVIIDKRKPTRAAGFAVCGYDDLQWIADGAKVLPDVCFGRAVREIPDE